jgi:hypothetical protein
VPAWISEQNALRSKERADELALLRTHAQHHHDIARRLRETPFFNQPLAGQDASDLLNTAVPWDAKRPPLKEFIARGIPEPDVLPLSLPRELDQAFAQSWDAGFPSELLELDVGWMDGLEGRVSWNPYAGSQAFETDEAFVRLPNFFTLDRWARAATAQGLASGNIEQASRRVGRLAWLELTTNNELGVASALAILRRRDRELAGRPEFVPLKPATAEDAEKAFAFRRSLALHCPDGCEGLPSAPLPLVLECAVANAVAADLSIERWFNGQDSPTLPASPACHFENVQFERQMLARSRAGAGPFPSVSLADLSLTLPSRVQLGATLARVFLPNVFIRNRHGPVARFSARRALERGPSH